MGQRKYHSPPWCQEAERLSECMYRRHNQCLHPEKGILPLHRLRLLCEFFVPPKADEALVALALPSNIDGCYDSLMILFVPLFLAAQSVAAARQIPETRNPTLAKDG